MATDNDDPPLQKCFAYESLEEQIGKQCEHYGRLHKKGDLGKQRDMYEKNDIGIEVPTECTSSFFRGGIIHSMECFEEFVYNLFDEAVNEVKKLQSSLDAKSKAEYESSLNLAHITELEPAASLFNSYSPVLLHNVDYVYSYLLPESGSSFLKELISQNQPITYYYLLQGEKVAKIEINKVTLCALMRFMYGIRCMMAHGDAERTLRNPHTLRYLHFCQDCHDGLMQEDSADNVHSMSPIDHLLGDTAANCIKCQNPSQFSILKNITHLVSYYEKCINDHKQDRKTVIKCTRFYPSKEPIENLPNDVPIKNEALRIIGKFFPNIDEIDNDVDSDDDEPLDENYALYHLCRVYGWLRQNKRGMYITYGLLVRINQLIRVIANRMRFTTANILMKKFKLPDGIFGVSQDKQRYKASIQKFESEHKKRVKSSKRITKIR